MFTARYERMPGFNLRSIQLIFVLQKVAMGQGFIGVLRFSPVSLTASMLYIYVLSNVHLHISGNGRTNGRNLRIFSTGNTLFEIGRHRIEKNHLVFEK